MIGHRLRPRSIIRPAGRTWRSILLRGGGIPVQSSRRTPFRREEADLLTPSMTPDVHRARAAPSPRLRAASSPLRGGQPPCRRCCVAGRADIGVRSSTHRTLPICARNRRGVTVLPFDDHRPKAALKAARGGGQQFAERRGRTMFGRPSVHSKQYEHANSRGAAEHRASGTHTPANRSRGRAGRVTSSSTLTPTERCLATRSWSVSAVLVTRTVAATAADVAPFAHDARAASL